MKLAVITGASSGIGEATARRLAADHWKVVLVARNRSKLEAIAAEIGGGAVVEPCDAGDGEAVLTMAGRVLREHGVPELIVNSAGAGRWARIEDTGPEEAVAMMRAPYFAAWNVTHAFIREMLAQDRGVIIHVGSPVSIFTWPSCVGYAAARWALRGMHEALCDDLAGTNVHSCHVLFGKVASAYFDNNPDTEEKLPRVARIIPTITPDACARVIARAASRPRRQVLFPFRLRVVYWIHTALPWLTRWLMRRTGG